MRDQIRRTHAQATAEGEAFVRMFGAVLSRSRELPLGIFEREVLPEEARAAAERALPALAAEAQAAQAAMEAANKRYAELEQLGDDLEALAALRDADVPQAQWGPAEEIARVLSGGGGADPAAVPASLDAALAAANAEQQRLREELRASDERAGRRLTLAMAASPEATKKSEAAALAAAFGILDQTLPALREVRRGALALHALWSRLEANRKSTRFGKELEERGRRSSRSTPASRASSPASPTAPTRSRPTSAAPRFRRRSSPSCRRSRRRGRRCRWRMRRSRGGWS